MELQESLTLLQNGLLNDLAFFSPELVLCVAIVVMLLMRLFARSNRSHLGGWALGFTVVAGILSALQWHGPIHFNSLSGYWNHFFGPEDSQSLGGYWIDFFRPEDMDSRLKGTAMFGGLLAYDTFTIFLRLFLYGCTALLIWLSLLTGIPDHEDSADFYTLLLGAALGMSLMASANHLLMVYIGVEMASLPSYALAGYLKGRRQSSEAALKYVVYGGGASGVMLYGISLVAGRFGTAYLPDLAKGFTYLLQGAPETGLDPILLLGVLLIFAGFGFKLSAVPFHFWCPDVFEGAAAEVAAFLSVASKGAAMALLGRFCFSLLGLTNRSADFAGWLAVARYLGPGLAVVAAVTATFGNLAAFPQTNLKRLLAYSTIAHAGYMMMGLAPLTREGAAAVLFYLIAYLFMNLGAFAVVAFLRNQTGSEDLSSYRGMVYRSPLLTITFSLFLLSLLGMPPLAGFAAKFQIFSILLSSGNQFVAEGLPGLGNTMYALLVIGGLNTVFSAWYYLRVLKVMILERPVEELEGGTVRPLPIPAASGFYALVMAAMILVIGVAWNPLSRLSNRGVNRFQATPVAAETAKVRS